MPNRALWMWIIALAAATTGPACDCAQGGDGSAAQAPALTELAEQKRPRTATDVDRGRATAKVADVQEQRRKLKALCPRMCERTIELKCANAKDCAQFCASGFTGIPCADRMFDSLKCALREPAEHWVCGNQGVAAIADGYCEAEQSAFLACLRE